MPAKSTKNTRGRINHQPTKLQKKLTETSDWNKHHEARLSMLWGKYQRANPNTKYTKDNFILKLANPRYMMKFIHDTNYSKGTKKNLMFMVNRWLVVHNEHKFAYVYATHGNTLRKEIADVEFENKRDENEEENYRERNFFLHIINELKPTYQDMTFKKHMEFLLLCMSVLTPTIRTSFYLDAEIIRQAKFNDKKDNFLFVNAKSKKVTAIINHDKVEGKSRRFSNKERRNIPIGEDIASWKADPFLKKLIFFSITKFPRTYLFQTDPINDNKVSANSTILRWLRTITNVNGITMNMMRSSFINDYHRNHESKAEREALALLMRHTVQASETHYYKIDEPEHPNHTQQDIKMLEGEIAVLENNLNVCERKEDVVVKEDVLHNKKRNDNIYNLNNGRTKKASQKTLDKYNIKFDDKTGKYY